MSIEINCLQRSTSARSPQPRRNDFVKINLSIMAMGLFSLGIYLYQVYEIYRVNHWSKIDAVVTESRTVGYDYMRQTRTEGTRFHKREELIFAFSYSVGGRHWVSRHFNWMGDSPSDAARDYPVGFHFTALYSAVDPAEAAVVSGVANVYLLVASMLLLAVGAVGLEQCMAL